jgi:hypothetical protein
VDAIPISAWIKTDSQRIFVYIMMHQNTQGNEDPKSSKQAQGGSESLGIFVYENCSSR